MQVVQVVESSRIGRTTVKGKRFETSCSLPPWMVETGSVARVGEEILPLWNARRHEDRVGDSIRRGRTRPWSVTRGKRLWTTAKLDVSWLQAAVEPCKRRLQLNAGARLLFVGQFGWLAGKKTCTRRGAIVGGKARLSRPRNLGPWGPRSA